MTGDSLTAPEAERIGLINRVVPADQLSAHALALAQRLADGAPLAIQRTKAAVNKLIKEALNFCFEFAAAHELVTLMSEDHQEAVAAIKEKRQPKFRGR